MKKIIYAIVLFFAIVGSVFAADYNLSQIRTRSRIKIDDDDVLEDENKTYNNKFYIKIGNQNTDFKLNTLVETHWIDYPYTETIKWGCFADCSRSTNSLSLILGGGYVLSTNFEIGYEVGYSNPQIKFLNTTFDTKIFTNSIYTKYLFNFDKFRPYIGLSFAYKYVKYYN